MVNKFALILVANRDHITDFKNNFGRNVISCQAILLWLIVFALPAFVLAQPMHQQPEFGELLSSFERESAHLDHKAHKMSFAENLFGFDDSTNEPDLEQIKPKGYFNFSSLALLFGKGQDDSHPVPSLTVVNGYRFNDRMYAGLGLGYEMYKFRLIPIFTDLTYVFKSDSFRPYVTIRFGGGIPLHKNLRDKTSGEEQRAYGGVLLAPSAGMLFPLGKKNAISLSIGYHYQEFSYETSDYGSNLCFSPPDLMRRIYIHYNRIEFRAGYLFR